MKKYILCLAMLCGFATVSTAQEWVDLMRQPDANFFEIRDAFNAHWQNKSYTKGQGYKQFKRWEAFWEYRVNKDGSFPDYADMWSSYQNYRRSFDRHNSSGARSGGFGFWSPIGPFDYVHTDSWSPGHGRINVIAEDPNNPSIIYCGAPAGGIWKSTDAGNSWAALGDSLPVIGVSGIAIDPNNSNIIYIATGDNDGGDTYSIGVWKSTDAGVTWTSTNTPGANTTGRIIIDPTNSNTIWCVSSSGVLRSLDAGTTWSNVRQGNFDDIALKPNDPQTVYAVTGNTFWRTTNGGTTWTNNATGLPSSSGRLKIAASADEPNYVYVLSAATDNSFQGIYRSTDSGVSFTARNTSANVFDGSTQAWYDLAFGCSPTDANTLVIGVLNVWRSTNGGNSWNRLNQWSNPGGAAYTHADIHFLHWFNGNLYCGSDGGIYKSTNNGSSFTDITPGLQIGQFYTIAGTEQTPGVLCGGLQDNGGFAYDHGVWRCYWGADGMGSAVDNNDSTLIFGMIQYGELYYSNNNGQSANWTQQSPSGGNWVTPLEVDPNNNRLLAAYDDVWEYDYNSGWNQLSTFNFPATLRQLEVSPVNSNTMYVSTFSSLYKTTNNGSSWSSMVANMSTGNGVTSIEAHPTDQNKIWVTTGGTSGNRVWYSDNGGSSWVNITGNLPNITVNVVKHEAGTANAVYVGTDIGVYYRDDNTVNWIPFMQNLPNTIVNDLEINHATGIIRAGTYGRGVWESGTYAFSTVTDDAGIPVINAPTGTVCGANFMPELELRNFGTNDITAVDILYSLDGGTQQTYAWTGLLTPGTSEIVILPMMNAGPGSHTFEAETSMPNGVQDNATFNDYNATTFAPNIQATELVLTLQTDCNGSQTTWNITNDNGIVVYQGGPYNDVAGGETITETFCVTDGCLSFNIADAGGDGLTGGGCSNGGGYTFTDGIGNVLHTGNPGFGSVDSVPLCISAPVNAFFTVSRTTVCEESTASFTDNSSGAPQQYLWSFPGGTPAISTIANPTIAYNAIGFYDVTLTVINGTDTSTNTQTNYIEVVSSPVATPVVTDESCAGACDGVVTATVSGGLPPYSYVWTGGLGQGDLHTNVCPGQFNLILTDDNGCVAPVTTAVLGTTSPSPVTDFTASTTVVFLDQSGDVTFTNTTTGATSYDWDFGDSNTSTATSPMHTYTTPGTYTVTLVAQNDSGCTKAHTEDILVLLTNNIADPQAVTLTAFPNPNAGTFSLNGLPENVTIQTIEVVNTLGQRVQAEVKQAHNGIDISLSEAAAGIYYLNVHTDQAIYKLKFTVE